MLSSDILTNFRGRGDQIHMHPLSFSEYYEAIGGDKREAYDNYSWFGGMPLILSRPDDESKYGYLESLFSEIYIKDLVEREKIEDQEALEAIIDLLCSSIGSLTNPQNIMNAMHSRMGSKISRATVAKYIKALENSFLFTKSLKYDIKGKEVLAGTAKLYMNDLAYKNFLYAGFAYGIGYKLENLVFLELKRAGYDVYTGYSKEKEVDFVARKNDRLIYIQSAYTLSDEKTAVREYMPLEMIRDSYEKMVVSLDDFVLPSNNGIRHVQAWNLLSVV